MRIIEALGNDQYERSLAKIINYTNRPMYLNVCYNNKRLHLAQSGLLCLCFMCAIANFVVNKII